MSNDEPDTVDDFHRSHNSLLGERVGIRQFHDQERVARMAEAAAALAKPVARRHTIGGLRNKSTVLTGPLVVDPNRPRQNPGQAVTPEKPPSRRQNTVRSKTTGAPSGLHDLLQEQACPSSKQLGRLSLFDN